MRYGWIIILIIVSIILITLAIVDTKKEMKKPLENVTKTETPQRKTEIKKITKKSIMPTNKNTLQKLTKSSNDPLLMVYENKEKPVITEKPKKKCPNCGAGNGLDAKYCFVCNTKFKENK